MKKRIHNGVIEVWWPNRGYVSMWSFRKALRVPWLDSAVHSDGSGKITIRPSGDIEIVTPGWQSTLYNFDWSKKLA